MVHDFYAADPKRGFYGGGGIDAITGGSGNNLLISGSGKTTLRGAGVDNILVGGTTNFDGNDQLLTALVNQGTIAFYGYAMRRALASGASNLSVLGKVLTFQDYSAHNALFGSGLHNWYLPGKTDTVNR